MEKAPYILACTRCSGRIESHTKPEPNINIFLCNTCHLKWQEIENKLLGHTYADEMRKAFISFVNDLAHLHFRNI